MNTNEQVIVDKKGSRPGFIAIVIAVIMIALVGLIFAFVLSSNSPEKRLQEQLDLGEKYLSELNYEQAIASYEMAIEIDPMSVEAYLGLADTYVTMDDYDNAVKVLEEGYVKTEDVEIKRRLDEVKQFISEQKEVNNSEDIEILEAIEDSEVVSEEVAIDAGILYEEQLQELVAQYGYFKSNQSGVMRQNNDKWLDVNGILGSQIMDFDGDGMDELLVSYTELTDAESDLYGITISMYDIRDGEVYLADSIPFKAYSDTMSAKELSSAEWFQMILSINAVYVDNQYFLMCEEHCVASAFADGMRQNYWLLEYDKEELQYVASCSQVAGGSSGFEYIGYKFVDGVCVESEMLFLDDVTSVPQFDSFGMALKSFFEIYKINIKDNLSLYRTDDLTSVLTEENQKDSVFCFTNKLVHSDNSDYTNMSFEFNAVLEN